VGARSCQSESDAKPVIQAAPCTARKRPFILSATDINCILAIAPYLGLAIVACDGTPGTTVRSFSSHLRSFGTSPRELALERTYSMPIGTVKFFNTHRGFGFIAPDGGGNDAFVHISAVERAGFQTLTQDQRVSYELEKDQRGKMSAVNLQAA
jgi:CspA family cold shock protein